MNGDVIAPGNAMFGRPGPRRRARRRHRPAACGPCLVPITPTRRTGRSGRSEGSPGSWQPGRPIRQLKAGIELGGLADLSQLRSTGSTGSPLAEESYHRFHDQLGDVMIAAISGGTGVTANFAAACLLNPVIAGEMQCRPLGVATGALDDAGDPLEDAWMPLFVMLRSGAPLMTV